MTDFPPEHDIHLDTHGHTQHLTTDQKVRGSNPFGRAMGPEPCPPPAASESSGAVGKRTFLGNWKLPPLGLPQE